MEGTVGPCFGEKCVSPARRRWSFARIGRVVLGARFGGDDIGYAVNERRVRHETVV